MTGSRRRNAAISRKRGKTTGGCSREPSSRRKSARHVIQCGPVAVIGFEGIDDYPHTVWGVGFRTYNPTTEIKCEEFCERYRKSLLELKHKTWQQHSLNGKFKFLRKLATYKVFGPKIEYAKGMLEFRVKWKIVRSVG